MCNVAERKIRSSLIAQGTITPATGTIRVKADPRAVDAQRAEHLTHDAKRERQVRNAMLILVKASHRREWV